MPQRRRLPFAASWCPPKFYFAGTSWLVLFSLLLSPLLPLLIVAPSLYGCNFLSYLPDSNGVLGYCLLPPGPALSLAPFCHNQLGVFLCLGLALGSVFMNGGWAASRRAGPVLVSSARVHICFLCGLFLERQLLLLSSGRGGRKARPTSPRLPGPAAKLGRFSQELITALRRLPGSLGSGRPPRLSKGSQQPRPRELLALCRGEAISSSPSPPPSSHLVCRTH